MQFGCAGVIIYMTLAMLWPHSSVQKVEAQLAQSIISRNYCTYSYQQKISGNTSGILEEGGHEYGVSLFRNDQSDSFINQQFGAGNYTNTMIGPYFAGGFRGFGPAGGCGAAANYVDCGLGTIWLQGDPHLNYSVTVAQINMERNFPIQTGNLRKYNKYHLQFLSNRDGANPLEIEKVNCGQN